MDPGFYQRLLCPIHSWFSEILKRIPQDGTFNQTAPLPWLVGSQECFSYDLTTATDRWPLLVLFEVFHCLFDRSFASSMVNSALATNVFLVPFVKRKWSEVCFVAGQPLGVRFKKYAVLGDDVVIAHAKVASVYKSVLQRLGVAVSLPKSLISNSGCIEFAKKFMVNGVKRITRFSTLCRIGGLGYRALGRIDYKRSLTTERRLAMWFRTLLPLTIWLGRGRPLNPYLRSYLIQFLLQECKPKDLKVVPNEYFEEPGRKDFLEWSLLRSWMESWLKLLRWYCITAMDLWLSIEDLL
ncbi:RNA-dependent RNA polymerase, mitoviral [Corchorus olitorius]|uniref:RNA-dependent RNA polymerase, mitoviral n=1 Tax=Corchorus olitorius TaxID=93759 RepID=A0A1R3KVD5_9ROSI|nr:RNA-dependent RNA polymerase, mitoviral [Corchorus olitorius]